MPTVRDYVCLRGQTGSEVHAVKATRLTHLGHPAQYHRPRVWPVPERNPCFGMSFGGCISGVIVDGTDSHTPRLYWKAINPAIARLSYPSGRPALRSPSSSGTRSSAES